MRTHLSRVADPTSRPLIQAPLLQTLLARTLLPSAAVQCTSTDLPLTARAGWCFQGSWRGPAAAKRPPTSSFCLVLLLAKKKTRRFRWQRAVAS